MIEILCMIWLGLVSLAYILYYVGDYTKHDLTVRLEWKIEDMWIGLSWKKTALLSGRKWDIWICLLPTIPLHIEYIEKNVR